MSDPKLVKAMEEIRFIFNKYDILGMATLASGHNLEFGAKLETEWSISTFNPETGEVRVKSKKEDYDSKEEQIAHIKRTADAFLGMESLTRTTLKGLKSVNAMIAKDFKLEGSLKHKSKHVPLEETKSKH